MPADNYYGADTVVTECYVKKLCNSLKKLFTMYKVEQKHNMNCTFTYKDWI